MARGKTSDITNKFKKMRKCKIIELLKSPEVDLTDALSNEAANAQAAEVNK